MDVSISGGGGVSGEHLQKINLWAVSCLVSLNKDLANPDTPNKSGRRRRKVSAAEGTMQQGVGVGFTCRQQSLRACSMASPALIMDTPQTLPAGDSPLYSVPG